MPKIMTKVFIQLGDYILLAQFNTPLYPHSPLPPPLISTFNEVKLARNKRHTEVQKIIFCSWSMSKSASEKSRLLTC